MENVESTQGNLKSKQSTTICVTHCHVVCHTWVIEVRRAVGRRERQVRMGVAAASAAASVGDPKEVVRGGRVVVRQKGQRRGWTQRSARRVVVAAAVFHPPHQAHPCSSRSRYLGARGSPFHGSRARRQKHADAAVIDTDNTMLRSLAQLLLIIRTRGGCADCSGGLRWGGREPGAAGAANATSEAERAAAC